MSVWVALNGYWMNCGVRVKIDKDEKSESQEKNKERSKSILNSSKA